MFEMIAYNTKIILFIGKKKLFLAIVTKTANGLSFNILR